jgi:hypothetical protein
MSNGHGEKLTRKMEAAIAALLREPTVRKAAEKAGVGERTLRRWLKDDAGFQSAYAAARRQLLEHSLSRLEAVAGRAVSVLRKALASDDRALSLRAALGVIDRATKAAEMLDLLDRVEKLEQGARNQRGTN